MKIENENTRIYTVFVSSGVQHLEAKHIKPTANEEILRRLQADCDGVDFVVGSSPHEVENLKQDFDAVLIFGGLGKE